jgi:hypothetical protein
MATNTDPQPHGAVRTTEQARSGVTPHMTRYVLTIGLALAVVAMIVIYVAVF